MKVACGLSLDNNLLSFSFLACQGRKIRPLFSVTRMLGEESLSPFSFIREHIDDIDSEIRQLEQKHSLRTEKIFFCLPPRCIREKTVENTVSLNASGNKKIAYKDVVSAKRQVENIVLDWKDMCLHHLVLEYGIGGEIFHTIPLGKWGRKLRIKSLIIFIERSLQEEFIRVFDNVGRKFCAFVYQPFADYSSAFASESETPSFVVHVKGYETHLSCFIRRRLVSDSSFLFGEQDIISAVAQKFSISPELASSIVFHYGSFKDMPFSKEISIKDGDTYLKLSSTSLGTLLREITRANVQKIVDAGIHNVGHNHVRVAVLGRLGRIDGFYRFLKDTVLPNAENPLFREGDPSAFGCIRYGLLRFFENDPDQEFFWQKLKRIYREYF